MSVTTSFDVSRGDETVKIRVRGYTEKFSYYNPFECGVKIADWEVEEPEGFHLTKEECDYAEDLLDGEIE